MVVGRTAIFMSAGTNLSKTRTVIFPAQVLAAACSLLERPPLEGCVSIWTEWLPLRIPVSAHAIRTNCLRVQNNRKFSTALRNGARDGCSIRSRPSNDITGTFAAAPTACPATAAPRSERLAGSCWKR
ncbi:hypothetical protein OBBRIDRAFT_377954 [Obba rivulosa]|uniref:Uncharacterized protein n=1 Tax=Obba rivulosa TaxID=1052685 RepID=A0A8E2DGF3_9APHY|nr:hypothetical protein OBBRIDRAFT_377954 [Obba rivulosa]